MNAYYHSAASETILIVDDHEANRMLLASQLQLEGYRTIQASDGQEGVNLAETERPDLILLDVMMPVMNGFQVCSQLKSQSETAVIPIIMVTALRDVQYRIKGIEVGADEFLYRPHHREELLVRVRSLIQLKHTRQRLEQERNRLQLLYTIGQAINTQLNLEQMMADIIVHTQQAVEAEKGNIILLNDKGQVKHKIMVRAGKKAEISHQASPTVMRQGLAGWLVRHNRGEIIPDVAVDKRWITLPDDTEQVGSAIGVPLSRAARRVVGVLILVHSRRNYFQPEHLSLLETIGNQLTAAIENAYLFAEISEQRQKLEALLAQSSDAIITTDERGRIALVNHAAESLFTLNGREIAGRLVQDVPHLKSILSLFNNGRLSSKGEITLSDEKTLHASVSAIPEVGYVAVMQDITELKRLEAQRLQQERSEKIKVKETFSRYMGPGLLEHVLSKEPSLLGRRERRQAVVMFADLRDSTRMIVDVEADQAIKVLNEHFTHMTEIVYEYNGTIFDLAGDELMIGFNVPFDQPDAVRRAVLTALRMQRIFDRLRQKWYEQVGTELGLGIGIDQGEVVVGNVGAETRMNFAMVGEAVNTAHRLVDLAGDGQIIISQSIYDAISPSPASLFNLVEFTPMGPTALKGKSRAQELYIAHSVRTPLQ